MLLRIYAIFITIAFCFLLSQNISSTKIIEHTNTRVATLPSQTIEKKILVEKENQPTNTILPTKNELCSYEINQQEFEADIRMNLERFTNYITLTAEEESRLKEYFKYQKLRSYFNVPENPDTIESILGTDKYAFFEKKEQEMLNKSNINFTKKQASYIARTFSLDSEKEELLISMLSSSDIVQESENAYVTKVLSLNPKQESEISDLFKHYEDYENIIKEAKEKSINTDTDEFNYNKTSHLLILEKAKSFLDEKQLIELEKYFKEQEES